MRTFIYILILFGLLSCSHKEDISKDTVLYYLINSDRPHNQDTIKFIDSTPMDSLDRFIAEDYFTYNKKEHIIKAFTSDGHSPMDGGRYYLTLDSLGIIYSRSTTWFYFTTLESNNDSTNKLIKQALGFALLRQKLHCYQCCDDPDSTLLQPLVKLKIDKPL